MDHVRVYGLYTLRGIYLNDVKTGRFCQLLMRRKKDRCRFAQALLLVKINKFQRFGKPRAFAQLHLHERYIFSARGDDVYLPAAVEAQEAARREASMTESAADAESLFFVSTMPGIAFTSFVQPTPYPADSNPRFMFGKFFAAGDRILLPFSVQVNHALLGGQQLTAFFEALDRHIAAFGKGKSL